jgi:hypothetical protein
MKLRVFLPGVSDGEHNNAQDVFEVEPHFYRADGRSTGMLIEVLDNSGNLLSRNAVVVSGFNGELKLTPRKPVVPRVDRTETSSSEETTLGYIEEEELARMAAEEAEED